MPQIDFNFAFINLGCNKNLVDTQFLMWKIFDLWSNNPNYNINFFSEAFDENVDYVFLNTCGFISSGRYEAFNHIEELLQANKKIYLLWCVPKYFIDLDNKSKDQENDQRKKILQNENVNVISWKDYDNIDLKNIIDGFCSQGYWDFHYPKSPRAYLNQIYGYEYLKIAEWCNNSCNFCIIPKIRWAQKSVAMEQILQEVETMVQSGISEIILIAQDTSRYWIDIYGKNMLFDLLAELENLDLDFKYRLLYLYPDVLTIKNIEYLASLEKFIPYFDIPLQHISSALLKRMNRFYDKDKIVDILKAIKSNFEKSFIRTNIIVWYPWESEADHQELLEFLKEDFFDNIALFEYHDEKLAPSFLDPEKVDEKTIKQRFRETKSLVTKLLDKKKSQLNKEWMIGYVMWFKSTKNWDYMMIRPELHAPEIDPYIDIQIQSVDDCELWIGDLVQIG